MSRISYQDFEKMLSTDLQGRFCVEIEFSVSGDEEFQYVWMGKMPDKKRKNLDLYWFGLKEDGSGAYDFPTFEEFSSAPVFHGKSLKEVWDRVEIESIDGFDPDERIKHYLLGQGPRMGAPINYFK